MALIIVVSLTVPLLALAVPRRILSGGHPQTPAVIGASST